MTRHSAVITVQYPRRLAWQSLPKSAEQKSALGYHHKRHPLGRMGVGALPPLCSSN